MTAVIEASNLSFHYPAQSGLLNQLNFSLKAGEILTVLGPNGIGKSTLLNCIVGLLTPTDGTLSIEGHPANALSVKERAKCIAYVPQQPEGRTGLSVSDYVVTGRTPYLSFGANPAATDYERVTAALAQLNLSPLADRPLNTLSGGQLQLVTIAKALVQDPKLIILDEPTSALDFGRQEQILDLIERLSQTGYAVLFTTHNPNHAFMLDQQVGLFGPTGDFQVGATKTLLTEERLRHTYQTDLRLIEVPELNRTICELPHQR